MAGSSCRGGGRRRRRRGCLLSVVVLAAAFLIMLSPSLAKAQSMPPAPAPTSDGMAIDQGIAYVLMMLAALMLTYLIHPLELDASSSSSYTFF